MIRNRVVMNIQQHYEYLVYIREVSVLLYTVGKSLLTVSASRYLKGISTLVTGMKIILQALSWTIIGEKLY